MPEPYNSNTTANELVRDYADIIKGKVVLVTGVTPGSLGAEFVESVAKGGPSLLILAGRSVESTQKTADAITSVQPEILVRVLQLDLASLSAVRDAAKTVNSWIDIPHIDVVVNSAGLMAVDYKKTIDGFESQFGVNHLGHFLFINLIIDKLLASKSPRLVSVSSDGHRLNPIRWADYNFHDGESYNKWHAYGQSKTANMLMALSLAEKLGPRGLQAFSLHPGVNGETGLGSHVDWAADYPSLQAADRAFGNPEGWATEFSFQSKQVVAATYVYASFDPNLKDKNGSYLINCRIGDPLKDTLKPWATSAVEAERLWKLSERLVGQEFTY